MATEPIVDPFTIMIAISGFFSNRISICTFNNKKEKNKKGRHIRK